MDVTKIPTMNAHGTSFQWCAVSAIGQESGVLSELWETGDSKVFLVRVRRSNEVFGLEEDASMDCKNVTAT